MKEESIKNESVTLDEVALSRIYEYQFRISKAQEHADALSTCVKVKVGSCIVPVHQEFIHSGYVYGCNHGCSYNCEEQGCHRVKIYGENSMLHRLPSDCVSIHSEIDAICRAVRTGVSTFGATIYVTRYPCEACARAIISAGIQKVIYGRKTRISEMTREMFEHAGIEVIHVSDWDPDGK